MRAGSARACGRGSEACGWRVGRRDEGTKGRRDVVLSESGSDISQAASHLRGGPVPGNEECHS